MSGMKIAIIDYGLGNVFSIKRALDHIGEDSLITYQREAIINAERIILPGVGAFGDAMKRLKEKKLDKVIAEYAFSGRPILGICLGMQLLMTTSEEFGNHDGLNLISGKVVKFPKPDLYGAKYKIPHVGWNKIFPKTEYTQWEWTILSKNLEGDFVYFVHSYITVPEDSCHILAVTNYGGTVFCSAVQKGNIFGCQFHPELSGESGLKIYREFIHGEI